jgi:DNA repair protein RadC
MYVVKRYKCRLVRDGSLTVLSRKADCSELAAKVLMESLKGLPHEEVHAIYLNGQAEILGISTIARGGLHGCALTPKDVFRGAMLYGASAMILGHNHPSGDPTPSPDDVEMTKMMKKAGELLSLPLLDHIVVCPERGTWRSIE